MHASITIYGSAFAFGFAPIPNILTAELFPMRARSAAMSVSLGAQFLCNTMVGLVLLRPWPSLHRHLITPSCHRVPLQHDNRPGAAPLFAMTPFSPHHAFLSPRHGATQ